MMQRPYHVLSLEEHVVGHVSYIVSFSSQMPLSDPHLLLGLLRTSMRCLLLFFSLFLYGFFEDFRFLDPLLWVLRDPGGNGKTELLHHIAEVQYILLVIHIMILFPINNLNRYLLPLLRPSDRMLLQVNLI